MIMGIGGIFKKKKVVGPVPTRHPLPASKPPVGFPPRPITGGFGKVVHPSLLLMEKVRRLSHQGIAEPEIVKSLRSEGYSSLEIDRALRDSLKNSVGEPELPVRERPVKETRPPAEFEGGDLALPEPPRPTGRPQQPLPYGEKRPFPVLGFGKPSSGGREVQELIEVTVDEKWKEVEKRIKGAEDKFAEMEERLKGMESSIEGLQKEEQRKDVEISTKIDAYKESMGDITAKMEGMESALKSALESVLDSNRTLAEAVRGLKERHRE